ncbi:MAG TPA: hypothetical protein VNK91_01890 [Burkholderiaceae bacterium]|nr:hypothetical protein [Burkholderiaceae bacterium]
MNQRRADAARRLRAWRENPVQFVTEEFKVEPDAWQRELLKVFPSPDPDKRRIALQSCAGPGKTAALAWCGWNFLACYGERGEHPKGAAVSITAENLHDNLWAELAKWRERSEFLTRAFEWTGNRIFARDHPETWFISARSFPKTANAEEQGRTLSGLHAKYVLYLIDESGDIAPAVLRAAEQGLSRVAWGKILQAGNATSHAGMLYFAAATQRQLWHVIEITGDPDDPQRSPRIDIEWARAQIATYGRDNPWVMAYILGKFPPGGLNQLIGPDECQAAMRRHLRETEYNWAAKVLGVDIALYGDDRTVLFPRQGLAAFTPVVLRNAKPTEIAARIARAAEAWDPDAILMDNTAGWAAGTLDLVQQAGLRAIGIDFGGKASDSRYFNKRAEMAFAACEWIKNGGALPLLPEFTREATAHTYTLIGSKFMIEPKEKVKEKLQGHSPDLFDGFIVTFGLPIAPRRPALLDPVTGLALANPHTTGDYDPFDPSRW